MASPPRILPAGDRALVIEFGSGIDEPTNTRVRTLAVYLDRLAHPAIVETVPTYRSLIVHFDPLRLAHADIVEIVEESERQSAAVTLPPSIVVEIPTAYGGAYGPDLEDVAALCGLTPEEVIAIHAGVEYRIFMLGFTPGFPYLGGMSPTIAVPRLATPRTLVPAGSVGIAARQTGIYPTASPGGWRIIGRTPVRLFDAAQTPPVVFVAGDRVKFTPVPASDFDALQAEVHARAVAPAAGQTASPAASWLDVIDGGMLTTVQDGGRVGCQKYGVPVSGAMDVVALRAANRLAGNREGAAALEMTVIGPELRFEEPAVIVLTGGNLGPRLSGQPVPMWQPVRVATGAVLSFSGRRDGLRGYLAIGGGIDVPEVLGSRSTYTRSGFGGYQGRAIRAGDRIPLGRSEADDTPAAKHGPARAVPVYRPDRTVRVILGPQDDAFTEEGVRTFLGETYAVSAQSDRIGCRLQGPPIRHRSGADIVSDGTPFGAVQVSGDGMPIVLMADRGTTGGYTKIATVVSVDLPALAQAAPGDRIRFTAIAAAEAVDLIHEQEAWLDSLGRGGPSGTDDAGSAVFDEDSGSALAAPGYSVLAAALGPTLAPEPPVPGKQRRARSESKDGGGGSGRETP